jgi:hypothetical protein
LDFAEIAQSNSREAAWRHIEKRKKMKQTAQMMANDSK